MGREKKRKFLDSPLSLFLLPIWLIMHPILMLWAIVAPKSVNNRIFKSSESYYNTIKRYFLVGKRSSRTSFAFAHGLMQLFIFVLLFITGFSFYNNYVNQSIVVKTKNLNIEVAEYHPKGHIQTDPNTDNKLANFSMAWANGDPSKMDTSIVANDKYMDFSFTPAMNMQDTTFFRITVHADFDLKIDTTKIHTRNSELVKDHILEYEIEQLGENDGKYYLVVNLKSLPSRDSTREDTSNRKFAIIAFPDMFEQDDPPYLNYFIRFGIRPVLELEPQGKYLNTNRVLSFSYWDSYTFIQDKDSANISNYPYYNVPYELIEAKPEPGSNRPYFLYYVGDKFNEAISQGIYLKFVNRDLLQKNDRKAFFKAVLMGALASFLLTILIELFTKWRNLNVRSGNKDPYNEEQ